MLEPLRLGVCGAAGRMGRRVVAAVAADPGWKLVAALEAPGHPALGQDAGVYAGTPPLGVFISQELSPGNIPEVMIDFSTPAGALSITRLCRELSVPLVCATTGLTNSQMEVLREAATTIPVVWSPNMSLMVNLTMRLAQMAANVLAGRDVDVEIIERHHRFKEDAPSGTALKLGQIIAEAMGQERHVHGRHGRPGPRSRDEIGFHAVRGGDDPGQHTVVFAMPGEVLELTVRATTRDAYVYGALSAAKFLVGKPPGLYSMADVLGL